MNGFNAQSAKSNAQIKRRNFSHLMMTSALVAAGMTAFTAPALADNSWANLTPNTGTFTTTTPNVNTTNINVTTPNGIATAIGNPDIALNDSVFVTANIFAVKDNRPGVITTILGHLNSNGTIVVIDDNGVYFGKDSVVDVSSLVATTGDINAAALQGGNSTLNLTNFGTGEIVNDGTITAADGGLVAFVGPVVKNNGIINATLGRVSLAAGNETATVDLYGDGLVELAYTDKNDALLSENTGEINAVGGTIRMTTAHAKKIVDNVVNMKGIARANSASVVNGKIILSAETGKVKVAKNSVVKGNTTIKARAADLDATIDGPLDGKVQTVNILSSDAKIMQGLSLAGVGGTVNVAAGTYDEDLVMSTAGVTLNGAKAGQDAGDGALRGFDETILTPHSPGIVITADNVTVDGLTITGADNAIEVTNADNVVLKNNILANSSNNAISLVDSDGALITRNRIYTTGSHGIHAVNSLDMDITHNQIGVLKGGSHNINGDGILIESSNGAYIYNNRIAQTTTTANEIGSGIHVKRSNDVDVIRNTIYDVDWDGVKISKSQGVDVKDNEIYQADRVGVYSSKSGDLTIENNDINGTLLRGVMLEYMAGNSLIKGNKINASGIDGITLFHADHSTISGNKIGYGLDDVFNTADDSSVSDHGISITESDSVLADSNLIAHTGKNGIFASNDTNLIVGDYTKKNSINYTGSHGIYVVGSAGAQILANQIGIMKGGDHNINGDGILVENSNGSSIIKNRMSKTTTTADEIGSGIHVKDSSDVIVSRNTAYENDWDGVKVTGGNNVTVTENSIDNVGRAGVFAKWASNFVASLNDINNADMVGVMVQDMFGSSTITKNKIDMIGLDGVNVLRADNTKVTENTIGYGKDGLFGTADDTIIDRDGVRVADSADVDVLSNKITGTSANGVHAQGVSGLIQIISNTIDNAGANGVLVDGYYPGTEMVSFAFVSDISEEAPIEPAPEVPNKLVVSENTINNSGNNGISLLSVSGDVFVEGNGVYNSGADGIYVGSNTKEKKVARYLFGPSFYDYSDPVNLLISNNEVGYSGFNGIHLYGINGDIQVLGNDIYDSYMSNGIWAQYVNTGFYDAPSLLAVLSEEEVDPDYATNPGNQLIIDGNFVDNSGYNGVSLYNVGGLARISHNQITNSSYDGIAAYNDDNYYAPTLSEGMMFSEAVVSIVNPIELYILDNTIENNSSASTSFDKVFISEGEGSVLGNAAIDLDIGSEGYAKIAGNTMGSNFQYGLLGYSGNIDLTGRANTIHDTNIGMGFYPDNEEMIFEGSETDYFEYLANKLHLVNDTIGKTAFVDQASLFVDLGYGAFFAPGYPTLLDGNNATYTLGGATIAPSVTGTITPAEYATLENMLYHYVDSQDRGLFFFNVLTNGPTIDQKDLFNNFRLFSPQGNGGSLVITGLPRVGGGVTAPTNAGGAFSVANLNDITPAAGEEDQPADQGNVAAIAPAAGGDTNNASCWADATQSLGQGTPVMFNFGAGADQLLQDTANCGGQGQTL